MWNLGKILQTPEVARMYVGSFWGWRVQMQGLAGCHFDTGQTSIQNILENKLLISINFTPKNQDLVFLGIFLHLYHNAFI